jgi:hypothetical protein
MPVETGRHRRQPIRDEVAPVTDDVFVVHNGEEGIGQGVMLQAINGKCNELGKHSALYLDFGITFGEVNRVFGANGPEVHEGLMQLLIHNIIPRTVSYDLRKTLSNAPQPRELARRIRLENPKTDAEELYRKNLEFQRQEVTSEGIFISHAQPDHDGLLATADEDLPIITTTQTQALQELQQKLFKNIWLNEKSEYSVYENGKKKRGKIPREYTTLSTGEIYEIPGSEGLRITTIPTDHWFGSAAIELEFPSGKRIFYTSDLNTGEKTEKLGEYLDKTEPYELMIIDGTHVGKRTDAVSDEQLLDQFTRKFSNRGPYYVYSNDMDFLNLATIQTAAKKADKQVYIPLSLASNLYYLHDRLGGNDPDLPELYNFGIYLQPNKEGTYEYEASLQDITREVSIDIVTQDQLSRRSKRGENGVIIFSSADQMHRFNYSRGKGLFGSGKELTISTFGFNPTNPEGLTKMGMVNSVLATNQMEPKKLNRRHHMSEEEWSSFITDHVRTENLMVLPTESRSIKHIVENSLSLTTNVLTDITPGVPMYLNGNTVPTRTVSYPR